MDDFEDDVEMVPSRPPRKNRMPFNGLTQQKQQRQKRQQQKRKQRTTTRKQQNVAAEYMDVGNDDDDDYDHEHDDGYENGTYDRAVTVATIDETVDDKGDVAVHRDVSRQNSCMVLAFVALLIAVAVFLVDKFDMMPQNTEIMQLATGETGGGGLDSGVMGNDVVNAEQAQEEKHAGIGKNKAQQNLPDAGEQGGFGGGGGVDALSAEDWLKKKGKTGHIGKDDPRWKNRPGMNPILNHKIKGGHIPMPSFGPNAGEHNGTNGRNKGNRGKDRAFKRRQWFLSNITLADGVKYEVVNQLEHDPNAFTEGLAYADGVLYESTGLNGQSTIRALDKVTGQVLQSYPLPKRFFGEGLTVYDGKAIQLTYKKKVGFVYDLEDLSKDPSNFKFDSTTGEGWGLTYDKNHHELIMSDGSEYLHFWDAETFEEKRRVQVKRQNGKQSNNINELEFWHDRVVANVWYEDTIIVIHPETGFVEKEYDFSALWPKQERQRTGADVLNGISRADDPSLLYFTGKNWDRMFLVKLLY